MDEPSNHSAVRDRDGYVWIRVEDAPDPNPEWKSWWPVIDGPCASMTWQQLQQYGPFRLLSADRSAAALQRVLKEID